MARISACTTSHASSARRSRSSRGAAPRARFRRIARANLVGFEFQRDVQVGRETGHESWKDAGHRREPRVSDSRSIFALVDDRDRAYFGRDARDQDQVGYIDASTRAIFGRSYAAEPDVLVKELSGDEAIKAADTLLLTIPNQLGVDYNAHVLESILKYVAPELGWR